MGSAAVARADAKRARAQMSALAVQVEEQQDEINRLARELDDTRVALVEEIATANGLAEIARAWRDAIGEINTFPLEYRRRIDAYDARLSVRL